MKGAAKRMKLYRGIKSREFSHFTPKIAAGLRSTWNDILSKRARGDFSYPTDLNKNVLAASRLIRLQRQHFTDRKNIALEYAKANDGVLIEIDVPTKDVLEHFTIEFQNFGQRKKSFEIVYVIDSSKLLAFASKWKLKTHDLAESAEAQND